MTPNAYLDVPVTTRNMWG